MRRQTYKNQIPQLMEKLTETYQDKEFTIDFDVIRSFGDDFKNCSEARIKHLICHLSGLGFLQCFSACKGGKVRYFYKIVEVKK